MFFSIISIAVRLPREDHGTSYSLSIQTSNNCSSKREPHITLTFQSRSTSEFKRCFSLERSHGLVSCDQLTYGRIDGPYSHRSNGSSFLSKAFAMRWMVFFCAMRAIGVSRYAKRSTVIRSVPSRYRTHRTVDCSRRIGKSDISQFYDESNVHQSFILSAWFLRSIDC